MLVYQRVICLVMDQCLSQFGLTSQKTHIVHQCSGLNFNDTGRIRSPFGCVKSQYVHHIIIKIHQVSR